MPHRCQSTESFQDDAVQPLFSGIPRLEKHAALATRRSILREHQRLAPMLRLYHDPVLGASLDVSIIPSVYQPVQIRLTVHSIYVSGLAKAGAIFVMHERGQYAGAAAGLSMLIVLASAVGFVRRRQYELFYILHIVLVAVILATVGFHTYQPPDISPRTLIIVLLAVSLWVVDRTLRLSTWVYYGIGNYCTLTPLPEGATRVTMHRSIKATPGSHVFLWIPGVNSFQTHPFTLLANDPAEFVIASRDGFTKHLHDAAYAYSDMKFRAALEGSYGDFPDPRKFDRTVLVAGGSGATFTLALALQWARSVRLRKHKSRLDFVWTVKRKGTSHRCA